MKQKKHIGHIAVISFFSLMLGGCGIYKAYQRPQDIAVPESYRQDGFFSAQAGSDTLSPIPASETEIWKDSAHIGLTQWETVFSDPYLQKLIRIGLDSNFDLRNAVLQVRQMRARLVQARLAYTPGLNGAASYTYSGIVNQGQPSSTYAAGGSASWEIDVFGKLLNGKRAAVAELLQSEAARRSVQTEIISSIATAYHSLLMLDRQLEISEMTVSNWNTSIAMMEAMKTAGTYNQAAVEQAKANSLSVKAQIPDLKRNIRELENSLCLLLGIPGQKIERGRFEDQAVPEQFSIGVPSQLLINRPDVMQAEAGLMAAYATTAQARAAFFPSFSIGANGNWTNAAGTLILDPARFVWQAVASLALPIFNKGANTANLRVAKAQQEIAANNFQKTILNAANEVSDALFQYHSSGAKCQYRSEQIVSLEKAVDYTTQLMQLGNTTYLEVLTAQQSLLQAQLSQVSDQYETMAAVTSLYRALGGGSQVEIEGLDADNFSTNKSVRKRTKAIEKEVKALLKQEKEARKEARQAARESR